MANAAWRAVLAVPTLDIREVVLLANAASALLIDCLACSAARDTLISVD
jgi:hypothetical protein